MLIEIGTFNLKTNFNQDLLTNTREWTNAVTNKVIMPARLVRHLRYDNNVMIIVEFRPDCFNDPEYIRGSIHMDEDVADNIIFPTDYLVRTVCGDINTAIEDFTEKLNKLFKQSSITNLPIGSYTFKVSTFVLNKYKSLQVKSTIIDPHSLDVNCNFRR